MNFDPYHKWLGILPKDQPPHHYRLLGLEPFEADLQVIEAAADRQLGFLRKFQSGTNAKDCQKLLNEVSRARLCLLKPATKQIYDSELRAKLAERGNEFNADQLIAASAPSSTKSLPLKRVALVVGGVLLMSAVGMLAFFFRAQPRPEQTLPRQLIAATPETVRVDTPSKPSAKPPLQVAKTDTDSVKPEGIASSTTQRDTASTETTETVSPAPTPPTTTTDLAALKPTEPSPTPETVSTPAADQAAKNEVPSAMKTAPIPDSIAQEAADKKLRELFKNEYGNLKKDEDKLLFAQKLEKLADDSDSDLATKYVCLEEARRLVAEAGNLTNALALADAQGLEFQIDTPKVKADTLKIVALKFKSPAVNKELIDSSLTLIDELMQADQFQIAVNVATVAGQVATRMKDKAAASNLLEIRRENEELAKEFPLAEQARATLQTQPTDTVAKAIWGRWLCLRKDNWDEGLKLLQDAGDQKLQELASRDLQGPTDNEAMIQLGSDWLDYAKSRKDRSLSRFSTRALHWLSRAQQGSTGLTKTRIEKLIEQAYLNRDKNSPLLTLINSVSKKVKQKLYVSSAETRHDQGPEFQELPPEGGILVGFNCRINRYLGSYTVIKGIQPIYATKVGLKFGEWRGKPEGVAVEVMAREGYAVSNIGHTVGACVDTIQVVFSRVTRSGLDLDNSYVSKKIGEEKNDIRGYIRGETPDNQPIIGMFGHANDFWSGFGVITAK